MLLQHLTELATRAHSGTSFSPEKRGKNIVEDFSRELEQDSQDIEKEGAKYGYSPEMLAGTISRYKQRYEKHLSAWLYSKSNCISPMITGPSRFPTQRAEKANNAEHNKYNFFRAWRERCLAAIKRGFKPTETPLTELERAVKDLDTRKRNHELMKGSNAIIRKAKGKDCTAELVALGMSERLAREVQVPDRVYGAGYPQFSLSNNLANIKRLEQRVKMLSSKAERHSAGEKNEITLHGVQIVQNFEADRLQLHFDGKPADAIREDLKRHGFRWSPTASAWQRKLTNEAGRCAKAIIEKHSELLK